MSTTIVRILGIAFLALAVFVTVVNIMRNDGMGSYFLPVLWLVVGAGCILWAKNRRL